MPLIYAVYAVTFPLSIFVFTFVSILVRIGDLISKATQSFLNELITWLVQGMGFVYLISGSFFF